MSRIKSTWVELSENRKEWVTLALIILILFVLGGILEYFSFDYGNLMTLLGGVVFLYIIAKRSQAMIENAQAEFEQGRNKIFVDYTKMIAEFENDLYLIDRTTNISSFTAAVLGLHYLVELEMKYKERVEVILGQLLQKTLLADISSKENQESDASKKKGVCCTILINILYNKKSIYVNPNFEYNKFVDYLNLKDVFMIEPTNLPAKICNIQVVNSIIRKMKLFTKGALTNSKFVAIFEKMEATGTIIESVDFNNSSFSSSAFHDTKFIDSNFCVELSGCKITQSEFSRSIIGFVMRDTVISNSRFDTCKLLDDIVVESFENCRFNDCLMSNDIKSKLIDLGNSVTESEDMYIKLSEISQW